MREYVENGVVKIIFVRSVENDADIFMKNTARAIFEKHMSKYMVTMDGKIG